MRVAKTKQAENGIKTKLAHYLQNDCCFELSKYILLAFTKLKSSKSSSKAQRKTAKHLDKKNSQLRLTSFGFARRAKFASAISTCLAFRVFGPAFIQSLAGRRLQQSKRATFVVAATSTSVAPPSATCNQTRLSKPKNLENASKQTQAESEA